MTTEELKALGLNEEQVKEVFKLHGLVIGEYKDLANKNKVLSAEKENLEVQLGTANSKIEEFTNLDIEGIKNEAADYKQKYEESTQTHQQEIENLKRDFTIESALLEAKVKNSVAAKALLNLDELNSAQDFTKTLNAQIASMKESDSYLFQNTSKGGSIGATGNVDVPKEKMTYSEMVAYLDKNPNANI